MPAEHQDLFALPFFGRNPVHRQTSIEPQKTQNSGRFEWVEVDHMRVLPDVDARPWSAWPGSQRSAHAFGKYVGSLPHQSTSSFIPITVTSRYAVVSNLGNFSSSRMNIAAATRISIRPMIPPSTTTQSLG